MNFKKVLHPADVSPYASGHKVPMFLEVEYEDGRLSISGVIGPKANGNAAGGCGQIAMEFKHQNPEHDDQRNAPLITPDEMSFAPGWDAALWFRLLETWKLWHLNDMAPGCEHQRAEGWDKRPIDPTKPTTAYGKFYPGQRCDSWNMLTWVPRTEHPEGLLSHPCPTCGYKYGSAWLKRDVPQDVLDFLRSLPDTDLTPTWV